MRLLNGIQVGQTHRSGWPFVCNHLKNIFNNRGILFDDFAERTLTYAPMTRPISEPWFGIFHHPPFTKRECNLVKHLGLSLAPFEHYSRIDNVIESLKWLKGAIVLSNYARDYYLPRLKTPVWTLKHPSDLSENIPRFSLDAFCNDKVILHYGWYLKIIPILGYFHSNGCNKICIIPSGQSASTYMENQFKILPKPKYKDVLYSPKLSNEGLDLLLSHSVVVTEYIELSASNVILECISRHTPIITKRHPAAIEYLGEEYPGFYDNRDEITDLLKMDKIAEIHEYLRLLSLNDESLMIETFLDNVQAVVKHYE